MKRLAQKLIWIILVIAICIPLIAPRAKLSNGRASEPTPTEATL